MYPVSEDPEESGRPEYDLHTLRRLFRYIRPYLHWVFLSLIVLFLNTGFDLSIPYVTKVAIDRYITPEWAYLLGDPGMPLPEGSTLPFRHDTLLVNLHLLKKSTVTVLEKKQRISGERLLVYTDLPPEILKRYRSLIEVNSAGTHYVIPQSRLSEFAPEDVRKIRGMSLSGVIRMAWLLLLLLTGSFVFGFILAYLLQYTGQRTIHDLRMAVISHILRLPIRFFDHTPVGKLTTRATNDLQAILEMYASVLVYFIKDIFLLFGILYIMYRMNARLTGVLSLLIPFIFFAAYFFRRYARRAFRRVRYHIARINAFVQETLQGISIIQVFTAEAKMFRRFRAINEDLFKAYMQQLYVFAVFRPLIEVFSAVAIAIIIWYGGNEILRGTLTFGALVASLSYIQMLFTPIRDLAEKYNIVQSAMAAAERVFRVLDEPAEPSGTQRLPKVRGEIEFRDVWFAYEDEEWVLKGVSFHVKPGEVVALVGPTGAGKTSIFSLLLGFYRPQKGQILLDGVDIADLSLDDLRSHIGMVFQDVFLFDGTVRENLLLRSEVPEENLVRALQVTQLDDLLARQDRRLDTRVGERGQSLSGGERQLLSFARAIARDYPIILLDEATSSVDSYTEALIERAFRQLIQGRTALIIAHRLSTVRDADRILVVMNGQIVEQGRHEELLEKRGVYYHLYTMQFEGMTLRPSTEPEPSG